MGDLRVSFYFFQKIEDILSKLFPKNTIYVNVKPNCMGKILKKLFAVFRHHAMLEFT